MSVAIRRHVLISLVVAVGLGLPAIAEVPGAAAGRLPAGAALPPGPATHAFTVVSPARLLDTRRQGAQPAAGSTTDVLVSGQAGVPAGAAAVVLNVTATQSAGAGYVTAFPAGSPRPPTSSLNLDAAGQTRAVQVTVAVGAGGKVSLFTFAGTHFVVDVSGYYVAAASAQAGRFLSTSPTRILDTRRRGPRPAAGATLNVPVVGVGGVPSNASAVVANLTATDAAGPGFVTAYPHGGPLPLASNLNLDQAGDTIANLVTLPVGTDGSIDLYTEAGTHLLVDLLGYYTGATSPVGSRGLYVPAADRLLDTRGGTRPAAGSTTGIPLGAAAGASAALLSAIVTEATGPGFISVFPTAAGFRNTSTQNNGTGGTVANATTVANDGGASVLTYASAHLVVDLAGWFTSGPSDQPVEVELLTFNDYHGHLTPPTGGDATLGATLDPANTQVGGAEYLAAKLAALRGAADLSITATAGDLIGGTPFLSGLFHDEPSVETLEAMALDVSSVGNHEFDEGLPELLRMQNGGCHPVDGCYFPADPYDGAAFPWLAANVVRTATGSTVLPPTWVKNVEGVKVGFIGMTLEDTPTLVAQAGIQGLEFRDEIVSANAAAAALDAAGVKAIVVLLHEGGLQTGTFGGCTGISGPIVAIAQGITPMVDMIVSGHTHQPYVCTISDPEGQARMVTSASSFGRVVTESRLSIDRTTGEVNRATVTSTNHLVARTVAKDPTQTAIIAKWNALSAPKANRVVGSIAVDMLRAPNRDAESALGNLIADAQLAATAANGAQIALMNPGGVRADLKAADIGGGEAPGQVTFGEAFTVQPFGNLLTTVTMTGAQIEQVLEQQAIATRSRPVLILGVSKGLEFGYQASAPFGARIDPASIKLNGTVIDPVATYRVTVNNFLVDGGDEFTAFTLGTNRTGGGDDLTAFNAYLAVNSPVASPGTGRIIELP